MFPRFIYFIFSSLNRDKLKINSNQTMEQFDPSTLTKRPAFSHVMSFLDVLKMLRVQMVNRDFYERVVPIQFERTDFHLRMETQEARINRLLDQEPQFSGDDEVN